MRRTWRGRSPSLRFPLVRALLLIVDGLGVGDAPDAKQFHPTGANTLGNLLSLKPTLAIPVLTGMGLLEILHGRVYDPPSCQASASYGRMRPTAAGNDSMSGHWELAGVVGTEPFAVYEQFPDELVQALERETGCKFLGNIRISALEAFRRYGKTHLETGSPILFTSASSALQISAHDSVMSPGQLYEIGRIARRVADKWKIARVILKPFTGSPGSWEEAKGRHDLTRPPPRTVFNAIADAGLPVAGVGKVADLFAQSGITRTIPAASDREALEAITHLWEDLRDGLVVANLSDTDTLYGHRRDPAGFARSLARTDQWLGDFIAEMEDDDLLIITSDHGNDPTFPGTDHTREEIPVLVRYDSKTGPLGLRESLADVAATLLNFFQPPIPENARIPGSPLLTFHRPPHGFVPH